MMPLFCTTMANYPTGGAPAMLAFAIHGSDWDGRDAQIGQANGALWHSRPRLGLPKPQPRAAVPQAAVPQLTESQTGITLEIPQPRPTMPDRPIITLLSDFG